MDILVFARYWAAGLVKTRLCPPLTPAEAALVHRHCLDLLVGRLRGLSGATVSLVFGPPEARPGFAAWYSWLPLLDEAGATLTERLQAATAGRSGPCLITGSDCPTVPLDAYLNAWAALHTEADVVVGPTVDGGVYLMGLRPDRVAWFEGIPWNTSEVSLALEQRAAECGWRLTRLPLWYDVDRPADLERLCGEQPDGAEGDPLAQVARQRLQTLWSAVTRHAEEERA